MMNESCDIRKFQDVSIKVDSAQGPGIDDLSLSLTAEDWVVVFAQKEQVSILWADEAEELVTPAQGTVTFLGENWRKLTANRAARQRHAAVLWMTNDLQIWNHPELRATTRCRMNGAQVQVLDEAERAA